MSLTRVWEPIKIGPFALNGLFVFWLGTGAFAMWFVIMARCLLRAARSMAVQQGQKTAGTQARAA
jgi:hypothetical protein